MAVLLNQVTNLQVSSEVVVQVGSCGNSSNSHWEGTCSKLGRDTDYLEWGFPWCCSVPPGKMPGCYLKL